MYTMNSWRVLLLPKIEALGTLPRRHLFPDLNLAIAKVYFT
jgi:hypothetical protein